jgi:hypothetical protein
VSLGESVHAKNRVMVNQKISFLEGRRSR